MIKALFKKQMMEVFSWVYQNKKSGKNRSIKGIIGYIILYIMIFGLLGIIFYLLADTLCMPLVRANVGWLYFAIMGLITLFMGVFGSVFNTYASLYKSNDNDLLLPMPIPPMKILSIRLSGVYFMGVMYELIVIVPTLIVWFFDVDLDAIGIICTLLIPFVISVMILVLSAILGWLVALISNKVKNKNIIVVILSLIFIAAYYYIYSQAFMVIQDILADPQGAADLVQNILYPLYHMGLAAQGNLISMLIFTLITGALFAITFWILSINFLKIVTANHGEAKKQYKEEKMVAHSVNTALLQKELRRFLGSANYMLNCGLGIIFMIVSAGVLLWQYETIQELLNAFFPNNQEIAYLIATLAICTIASMNDMSAPSVSLEGKNIWLVQVFPVSGKQVLMAKLKLHLFLTLIPATVLILAVEWVIKPSIIYAILIPIAVYLFIILMAEFGLFLNMKSVNLNWTNEIVPLKQSMGVMICLFGSWAIIVAFALGYYFLSKFMNPFTYFIVVIIGLLIACFLLYHWLCNTGAKKFEKLS